MHYYLVQSFLIQYFWPCMRHWCSYVLFIWWPNERLKLQYSQDSPREVVQNSIPRLHSQPWRWAFSISILVFWCRVTRDQALRNAHWEPKLIKNEDHLAFPMLDLEGAHTPWQAQSGILNSDITGLTSCLETKFSHLWVRSGPCSRLSF